VGELRNHATRRSGSRVFCTSLEARSEVEKKTALILVMNCILLYQMHLLVDTLIVRVCAVRVM